jgi:predicted RNA-binding protein YlqC (UPF0109 family)
VRELLEFIAKELVEDPDAVAVTEVTDDRGLLLQLSVGREDMGRVIGRGGRTARAIRLVMKAAAVRDGTHVAVEILD